MNRLSTFQPYESDIYSFTFIEKHSP